MHNIETSSVLLTVNNDASTAHVTSTSDHNDVTGIELDEISDFVLLKVELDSIVNFDGRIGVPDGTTVVGNDVRDTLSTESQLLHLAELVGSFFRGNTVDGEATLDVVQKTEVFTGFLQGHNICKSIIKLFGI